jgi:hypothetical protein
MRPLPPPTLTQLGCYHQWVTTHTRSDRWYYPVSPWPRVRYVRCVRCRLRAKTVETLEAPLAVHNRS